MKVELNNGVRLDLREKEEVLEILAGCGYIEQGDDDIYLYDDDIKIKDIPTLACVLYDLMQRKELVVLQ